MSAAPFWIQSSDMSAEDFPAADVDAIARALKAHDWAGEFARQQELEARDSPDVCPAGLGVVHEDGRILHICPDASGRCMLHYSFSEPGKVLGFIPWHKAIAGTLANVPMKTAEQFIAPFLENDFGVVSATVESLR